MSLSSSAQDVDKLADSLLAVANSQPDDSLRNNVLLKLARAYFNKAVDYSIDDDKDSTLIYLFKSLEVYNEIDDKRNQVNILTNIALTFSNYDEMAQAFDYLNRSMSVCKQLKDPEMLARNYFVLGVTNHNLNNFSISNDYFHKSRNLFEQLADTFNITLLNAAIAKNDYYIALSNKCTEDMISANIAEQMALSQIAVNDNNLIDYLNYCHSFIDDFFETSHRITDPKLKEYYVSTMQDFYDKAAKYKDYTSWFETQMFVSKAYIFLLKGDLRRARAELDKIKDRECLEYYASSFWYYKYIGNYKEAMRFYSLKNCMENRTFNAETSLSYERNQAQAVWEDKMLAIEKESYKREMLYQEEYRRAEIRQRFLVAILVLAIVIVILFVIESRYANRLTSQLRQTNYQIMEHNSELQIVNEEVRTQTESIKSLKEIVEIQRLDLKALNSSLMKSIKSAENIQLATIPYIDVMNRIFGECFVFWKPRNIVSGDFYWATEIGNFKYLVTADCTGHGVPGGLLSILGISILNDIACKFLQLNAAEILDMMKVRFVNALNLQSGMDDGIDMSLVVMDKPNLRLQYAGARRPLYIVRNNSLVIYRPDMKSIGRNFVGDDKKFTNHSIEIREGDMLYTFTDGIPDQVGGADGNDKFSLPSLKDLLAEIADFHATQQYSIIAAAMQTHQESAHDNYIGQLDDQLMVAVRV